MARDSNERSAFARISRDAKRGSSSGKRGVSVKVEGLEALLRSLKQLPGRVHRKVLKAALMKASTPVLKDAKKRTPVGAGLNPDGTERPNLKNTLVRTKARVSAHSGTAYVALGPE